LLRSFPIINEDKARVEAAVRGTLVNLKEILYFVFFTPLYNRF
jgi:hypothetical protein